jgi:hypothetical protein
MHDDTYTDNGNSSEGFGEILRASGTRDVRLLAMALNEHWEMPPAVRAMAIQRLEFIVMSPDTTGRAFGAALKALITLSRHNLAVVDTACKAKAIEEHEERLKELESRLEQMTKGNF